MLTSQPPATPKCGCAVNADSTLKEAHEIEFSFSPSAKEHIETATTDDETLGQRMHTCSTAQAVISIKSGKSVPSCRGGKHSNAPIPRSRSLNDLGDKSKSKESQPPRKKKKLVVESDNDDQVKVIHAEQDSELLMFCLQGQKRGRGGTAKDIPLIFTKDTRDGKTGHWCDICKWFLGRNSSLRTHIACNYDTHFKKAEWDSLVLIQKVLAEPATAQASFLSEAVPTVWKLLLTLEFMQTHLEDMQHDPEFASVKHGLEKALKVLAKYYWKTDATSTNIVTLVLNPGIKMEYIKANWGKEWLTEAEETMGRLFDRYHSEVSQGSKSESRTAPHAPSPVKASSGYGSSWLAASLKQYLESPLALGEEDIVGWWGLHCSEYPTLSQMARDYLAIQGSAAPCERCFSSSGQTGTSRCNCLLPKTFEVLQILKNAYKTGEMQTAAETLASQGGILKEELGCNDLLVAKT
ncbi:hypothetical protein M422DRAFT_57030 [Sphaerobolus stellatus SS14]|uniref:HAT C-terminal dimerisation domain-containing protein n=1 Tax=Sphaerobolus stellatus (strain SS14) TaxID=990650 RepID=A0A0C9T2A1_SPHS4|nr:hypothetical protein M422DRAFT_57030 [Sphaerobolus stellatus SS14]